MTKAIVTVIDKRCLKGTNIKSKCFQSDEEAVEWAKSVKNRVGDSVCLLSGGICRDEFLV